MKRHHLAAAVFFAVALAATAAAITIPKVNFTDTRLKNGLRVIISSDRAAPVVSVAVAYNVGSRNERKGRTGFAHLFEHLMFKGSENVADGELAGLIENYGGNHNGQTDKDHTHLLRAGAGQPARHGAVPRGRSHAIARHHAGERRQPARSGEGRAPAADGQSAVRQDVGSHRRARCSRTSPTSIPSSDRWPTSTPPRSRISRISSRPTTPRTTPCWRLPGDVDPKIALDKVRKYFEAIPSGPPPPPLDTTEPAQKEERRTIDQRSARAADPRGRRVSGARRHQPRYGRVVRARDGDGFRPQLEALRQPRPAAAGRRAGRRRRRAGQGPDVHVSRRDGGTGKGSGPGREGD